MSRSGRHRRSTRAFRTAAAGTLCAALAGGAVLAWHDRAPDTAPGAQLLPGTIAQATHRPLHSPVAGTNSLPPVPRVRSSPPTVEPSTPRTVPRLPERTAGPTAPPGLSVRIGPSPIPLISTAPPVYGPAVVAGTCGTLPCGTPAPGPSPTGTCPADGEDHHVTHVPVLDEKDLPVPTPGTVRILSCRDCGCAVAPDAAATHLGWHASNAGAVGDASASGMG